MPTADGRSSPAFSSDSVASRGYTAAALSIEMLQLTRTMQVTPSERARIECALCKIQDAMRRVEPMVCVDTCGSFASGVCLFFDGVDCVCACSAGTCEEVSSVVSELAKERLAASDGDAEAFEWYLPEHVDEPRKRLHLYRDGIAVSLLLTGPRTAGRILAAVDTVRAWMEESPDVAVPVVVCIKLMLHSRLGKRVLSGYELMAVARAARRQSHALDAGACLKYALRLLQEGFAGAEEIDVDGVRIRPRGCCPRILSALCAEACAALATETPKLSTILNRRELEARRLEAVAARQPRISTGPAGQHGGDWYLCFLTKKEAESKSSLCMLVDGRSGTPTRERRHRRQSGPSPQVASTSRTSQPQRRYQGVIKSFVEGTGFGFIRCPELTTLYGADAFLHRQQFEGFTVGDAVEFQVNLNRSGKPQARALRRLEPARAAAPPATAASAVQQAALQAVPVLQAQVASAPTIPTQPIRVVPVTHIPSVPGVLQGAQPVVLGNQYSSF
eukprot:TRINITY_DN1721_c8_g5_i1.p1 TRINITY_DN1721_c8_g5~~TRINITY_DN1721_c8_g5_i1.p1  ORF type:complete len:521 (+),score=52.45 TRINITY_DN1721_c8_g5_i1:57-1565(+)